MEANFRPVSNEFEMMKQIQNEFEANLQLYWKRLDTGVFLQILQNLTECFECPFMNYEVVGSNPIAVIATPPFTQHFWATTSGFNLKTNYFDRYSSRILTTG